MMCLQFIMRALASGKPTTFYEDEFRCPIFVGDICAVVSRIVLSPASFGQDGQHRCAVGEARHSGLC